MLATLALLLLPILSDPLAEARAAAAREDWDAAAPAFRADLDAHPDSPRAPEARFWLGFCLAKQGENDQAIEILSPFNATLAKDKWADDALLQIGKALRDLDRDKEALDTWRRHLDAYPDSVWRTEVTLGIIDILFHDLSDLPGCLGYCERLTREVDDRSATTEARYIGAYCLNALRRFDESEAWADRLFDPESPLEEAWRAVLGTHRDLLRGRADAALAAIDAIPAGFPDLDGDARHDLLLRTTYVLRFNGRADRARALIVEELYRSAGRPIDEVDTLIDELKTTFGDDRRADYLAALGRLAADPAAPIFVRVSARDTHAHALADDEKIADAEALLRAAIASETAEFPRFRAAMTLFEILANDVSRQADAVKTLDTLRSTLKRRDLTRQLSEAADRLR